MNLTKKLKKKHTNPSQTLSNIARGRKTYFMMSALADTKTRQGVYKQVTGPIPLMNKGKNPQHYTRPNSAVY